MALPIAHINEKLGFEKYRETFNLQIMADDLKEVLSKHDDGIKQEILT